MVLGAADHAECGQCSAAQRSGVFICPGCGASRGQMMSRGDVHGDRLKRAAGFIAPAVIAAMFLPLAYVVLPLALFGVYRLARSRIEQPGV
jgi:hypothetical protein